MRQRIRRRRRLEQAIVSVTLRARRRESALLEIFEDELGRAGRRGGERAMLRTSDDEFEEKGWAVRTPYEFCFSTTDPLKRAEFFTALRKGVTLSARLPIKRMGWDVSPRKSSEASR